MCKVGARIGLYFFEGVLVKVPAFISILCSELLELSRSFQISQIALSCLCTLSACKCDW